ncbi:DUF4149 domain-containing protein [Granulicella cerasi]|uniref:DUF4149 domain-containing protein n=1 Tax=Granulicella cerasi TaxID=741063 RepID=A0ABW1Z5F4_9BACT|nr:DUF4149 domain-containing protein [Granulicella cerasi]
MALLFRSLRLIALSIWVGGIVFFVAGVTIVAFKSMPDAHTAGIIVRGSLLSLHRIGLIAGGVYLFFTLALLASQRDTHPVRAVELAIVISMIVLTGYSQMSVIPRMDTDRLTLGGDVSKASPDNPAYKHFSRLHGLSEKLEGVVLIEGLVLLILAPVHGRDDFDRFA